MSDLRKKWRESASDLWPSLLSVIFAFVICAILLKVTGHHPLHAYQTLIKGAFGNKNRIAETLVKATPLMVMALGTSVAFRCQIWNIGGNGQYTVGAIASIAVALYLRLSPVLLLPLTLAAAVISGGLLGAFVGFLKAKLNANEVITTLMLNYIILYMLAWLVKGPMIDPEGFGFPQTPLISDSLKFPILIPRTRLHAGLLIAILLVVGVVLFWRSKLGFRISMVGESQHAARYCGIRVSRNVVITMIISSGLAAIAGWIDVFGLHYRLMEDLAGGYGSMAIVIALLGQLNPVGIAFSSVFFAALVMGGSTMQRFEGIPYSLVEIIQGLVIIFVISRVVYVKWKEALIKE